MIARNGHEVVGFGESATPITTDRRTGAVVLASLSGAAVGAIIGNGVNKNFGGLIGALVTGAGVGGIAYALTEDQVFSSPPSGWRPLTFSDLLQPGQQIAVAIASNATVSQDVIEKTMLTLLLPGETMAAYAPGARLPADWPADDNLGTNAFRYSTDLTVSQAGAAILQLLPPEISRAWVRNAA